LKWPAHGTSTVQENKMGTFKIVPYVQIEQDKEKEKKQYYFSNDVIFL